MRSYEVIVQPRAEREIKETHDFLATTAPASAERWLNGISKANPAADLLALLDVHAPLITARAWS